MKIAIIDDSPSDRQEAETIFRSYLTRCHPAAQASFEFLVFDSAEAFLSDFAPNTFTLIILDIYMKKMNGLEAARRIRSLGEECPIVFLTTSDEHVLEGYSVFAAGYFIKPLHEHTDAFLKTLDHCLPNLLNRQQALTVATRDTVFRIPFPKILFIDCSAPHHNVRIHMTEASVCTIASYAECYDVLSLDGRFLECYHRILVNMDFIDSMEDEYFQLTNTEHIPISRRKKNQVQKQYMLYLLKK